MNITHAEDAAKWTERARKEAQLKKVENDIAALGDRAERAGEILGEINQAIFIAMVQGQGRVDYIFEGRTESHRYRDFLEGVLTGIGYVVRVAPEGLTIAWSPQEKDKLSNSIETERQLKAEESYFNTLASNATNRLDNLAAK